MNIELNNTQNIILRDEIEWMKENWGYNIILVRTSKMLCSCSSKEGQQSTSFCSKCLGIGRKIRLEKKLVIGITGSQTITRPNTTQNSIAGEMYSDAKKFYCDYSVHPKIGNYIYEVSWKNNKPVNIHGIYKIEYCEPMRMDNGKIEYYALSTHREVINIDYREKVLKDIYRSK